MTNGINELLELCNQIEKITLNLDGDEYYAEKSDILNGNILSIKSYLRKLYLFDLVKDIEELDLSPEKLIQTIEYMNGFIIPTIRKSVNNFVEENIDRNESFWEFIHPRIKNICISRYQSGHYADAVESALKEVNSSVKAIVKSAIGEELDGAKLMGRALSVQNPIIKFNDLESESDKNIQQGYLQIFQGAIIGIRNPKAHENMTTERNKAIHLLFLASLLMNKIDERIS
ncbi:MAG: TIGR02391 family protein [Spirochaetales bacterium]|nr:TIGR02391 family protein [Spirochaetales bacterium]